MEVKIYKILRSIGIMLVLILLMAVSPPELRAQSMDMSTDVRLDENDALLYDAEIYAKNQGVSVEEALYRFHIQDVAVELEAKLRENEFQTFAGLWLEHVPEFKVVVLFTQDGEESITPYLTEELADIVSVQSANTSLAELQEIQKEAVASLRDLEIPVESEINVYENNVKIFIAEADKLRLDDALQVKLLVFPDQIKVITVPELGRTESNIYGGLNIACTTGFSVEHSQGTRGVATAAHCSDNNTALYYNGVILPIGDRLKIGSYDVEWLLTPGFTVTNQFQTDTNGYLRRANGTNPRDSQVIGGYVCKYGVTSGYTCGYISSKTFWPASVPNSNPTFIRVNNTAGYNNLSSGGDSGGPWFISTTAYGIHHGEPGDDPGDAIYMAINYIGGLGVSVVLAPRFADVPWDYWAWQDIERLYNSGITAGCGTNPLIYCPDSTLTRAQMAVFLLRGIHGAAYSPPPVGGSTGFDDVPVIYWAAAWIKQFAVEGITSGCSYNPPLYCPEGITTQAQMAVFLLRSKYGSSYSPPPVGGSTGFYDVPTNYWAAAWIKQLKVEGITTGCSGGNFCPESYVTRAQMAGLFVRTFNLP